MTMSEESSAIYRRMLKGEATSAEYVAAVRRETCEALEKDGFKMPRAPRRYQAEVDAVRQEKNKLAAELRQVRAERRRFREALKVAADDLDKAANQFAGIAAWEHSGDAPRVVSNPRIFAEKAARARAAAFDGTRESSGGIA